MTSPEIYEYYQLYPFPSTENKIIIPTKLFLTIGKNKYQFNEENCKKSSKLYICKTNQLIINNEQCIAKLLQLDVSTSNNCMETHINITHNIIEKINEARSILLLINHTKIALLCHIQTETKFIKGYECVFSIIQKKFSKYELDFSSVSQATPIFIPNFNFNHQYEMDHKIPPQFKNTTGRSLKTTI